jgi:Holliday junction DNA helicase RuvA
VPAAAAAAPSWRDAVQSGLVNLGWPARDAERAVAAVADDMGSGGATAETVDVATALRAAMRKLSAR